MLRIERARLRRSWMTILSLTPTPGSNGISDAKAGRNGPYLSREIELLEPRHMLLLTFTSHSSIIRLSCCMAQEVQLLRFIHEQLHRGSTASPHRGGGEADSSILADA